MKIRINDYKNSKNAIANVNIELENGLILWNVELIKFGNKMFLSHSFSYQAKNAVEDKGIKVGDWVSKRMTFFPDEFSKVAIPAILGAIQPQPQTIEANAPIFHNNEQKEVEFGKKMEQDEINSIDLSTINF